MSVAQVARRCRERLADFKVTSRIELRDHLPRTETGKIWRAEL